MAISAGRSQFSVRPLSLSDYPAQVEPDAEPVTLEPGKQQPGLDVALGGIPACA